MTTQLPLLDRGPDMQLPGPMFRARPGWGGRLREWMHENLYVIVFRLLLLAAAGLVIASLLNHHATPEAPVPSPTATPTAYDAYYQVALAGEGMTHLAAKTINDYSDDQIPPLKLDAIQHLFAVDTLARTAGWRRLRLGDEVSFRTSVIQDVIFLAKALTPAQRAAWARFLR
ncbi:MAG TPA: hypothetical protein VMU12_02310 [Candidatus Paceibacterota bacterium]|nr:hypothetical protein [Candidatus Paceibacterota bacterium]